MVFFKKKKASKEISGLPPDMVYSMEPRHGHGQDVLDENGIRQVAGCLPIDPINKRFLLVTSSSNPGTWVIPKGGWEKDETQQQAAMRETWEEAGVKGVITRHVGVFAEKSKGEVKAHHWVYEMEIKEVTKKFPEQKKRDRRWFSYDEAMLVVKASYIHDALSMSSLSPLSHPQCESLQSDSPDGKKKEKKKKKKVEDDSEEDSEEKKEKKEKKKKKKKEKKDDSEDDELTEEQKELKKLLKEQKKNKTLGELVDDSDDDKKEKKKKKKGKKGEIIELKEEELPPMVNNKVVDVSPIPNKHMNPDLISQQLRQTHITPPPKQQVNAYPTIPQQQFNSNNQRPPLPQQQQFRPQPPPPQQQFRPQQGQPYPPQPQFRPHQGPPYPQQQQQQQFRPPPPQGHPYPHQHQQRPPFSPPPQQQQYPR